MAEFVYDHIHVRSPDPEGTGKWYENMFGATIIRTPRDGGPDRVDLNLDGLMVFIAGPPDSGTIPDGTSDPHYGLDHFGLRVENLDQTVATMKSKGAEFAVEPVQFRPDVKLAFVWAPDGVRIELLERQTA